MHRKTALLAFVASALVASGIGPAAAQKQTLKMAYWAGPSHHMVQTQEAWAKTIFDASGGNLVIEVDKAPLAKPDGQYDIVKNGVRDLVWHVPGYTAGRFDLFQAPEQPFLCPSSTVCSTVLWKWYAKHGLGAKEFTDTTLVTAFTTGPFSIHLAKPARTLEEIRALKIRVAGASVPVAKALGWSVAVLPATDAYETLQRGVVDGTVFPWEAVNSFRLNELVKFHLEDAGRPAHLGLHDRRQHQGDREADAGEQGGVPEGRAAKRARRCSASTGMPPTSAAGPTPSSATTSSRPSRRPSSTSGGRCCRRPPTNGSRRPMPRASTGRSCSTT